ncbi:MAG: hypothetical protein K2O12_06895, partial [Muribaculaceae bacterium]|nr:hypothetical protein [Muribaculaceae bacterium]
MTSTNRQIQEQKLQQKLAPMQVQYVRMLEMTTPEIEDAVRQAVEDNPALETIDSPALPDEPIHSGNDDALDDQYHNPEKKSARDWIAAVSTDSNDETLTAHLEKQLAETDTDETTLHIARYLLGEIDNNGRISRTPAQIADDLAFGTGLTVSADNVRKALD